MVDATAEEASGRSPREKMKAGEEGKVICHNDGDGGGGGGGRGQTSTALKWTKVKEIIFVSTDDDDAKLNRVNEDCEREREIEFCAHSELKDERERARGRIESDFEAGQFAAEERSFLLSLFPSVSWLGDGIVICNADAECEAGYGEGGSAHCPSSAYPFLAQNFDSI